MALMANYPFALAPGLGLNAYFAYTVCTPKPDGMGYDWRVALMAVFIEGLVFIVLSLTNIREAIFNAIPETLKKGVSAGIGLFVAFIGFQNAKIIVNSDSTLVTYVNFREHLHQAGICAILALIGVLVIAVLYIKKVSGAILIGIIVTWVLGMLCQAVGIYVPDPEAGFYSCYPTIGITNFASLGKTFGQCFRADFSVVSIFNMVTVVFSFLFVDIFDTLGTLIGCSEKAGYLDEQGRLPNIRGALMADSVATCAGAVLGTSTTTTFVESSAGVSAGGRTGLAATTTAILFLVAVLFAPVFISIPGFATAPALIFVGFLMLSSVLQLNFSDYREAIPAYLTLIAMPLSYSIAEGIAIGIISFVVINLVCNVVTSDKRKVTPLMIVLAVLFVLKYVFL